MNYNPLVLILIPTPLKTDIAQKRAMNDIIILFDV